MTSKKRKSKTEPTSKRVAREIRALVLASEEGEFLGSEDQLLAKMGVSRPTFRQATKLLEQEHLLTIKRGVGGGFFARLPDSDGVAHMTRVYLQSRKATMRDAIEASAPLFVFAADLAAHNRTDNQRDELVEFLDQEERTAAEGTDAYLDFVRSERKFGPLLAAASGNPMIELNILVLYHFAASLQEESLYRANVKNREVYRALRNQIASAIIDGDRELARLFAERMSAHTLQLMRRRDNPTATKLISAA